MRATKRRSRLTSDQLPHVARQEAKGDGEFQATIYSNLAAAYAKKGDHKQALEAAEEAVRLRPDWAKAHSRKGLSLQGGRVC